MTGLPPDDRDAVLHGASVCAFRGDEVLMIRRAKPPGIGLWAPAGGGIEPGETAEAAALREVVEETAVTVRLIGRVGIREIVPPPEMASRWRLIRLEVFAAVWLAGEPDAGSDAGDARFVTHAGLDELPLMPGVRPWIDAARRLFDGQER